jgi:hypothetical protein
MIASLVTALEKCGAPNIVVSLMLLISPSLKESGSHRKTPCRLEAFFIFRITELERIMSLRFPSQTSESIFDAWPVSNSYQKADSTVRPVVGYGISSTKDILSAKDESRRIFAKFLW